MKIASRILSLLILVVVATVYTGCKKDDDDKKTVEETQFAKLKGVWTVSTVVDSNGERTGDFIDTATDPDVPMKLTLEGNYAEGGLYNYSLTGPRPNPSPWPSNGEWQFGTNKSSEIIRDPGKDYEVLMGYTVTDETLIITFNLPEGSAGFPGGRVSSVTGDWTFTFTK